MVAGRWTLRMTTAACKIRHAHVDRGSSADCPASWPVARESTPPLATAWDVLRGAEGSMAVASSATILARNERESCADP
eukprot:4466658-Prymnesium_polylepis.1